MDKTDRHLGISAGQKWSMGLICAIPLQAVGKQMLENTKRGGEREEASH